MKIKILPVLFILLAQIAAAQDLNYARRLIDTLAAPGMHGRGYVADGDRIAAQFLSTEFKKLELRPLGNGYKQT